MWLEARCSAPRGPRSARGSAASARARSSRSTSGSSPTTTRTACARNRELLAQGARPGLRLGRDGPPGARRRGAGRTTGRPRTARRWTQRRRAGDRRRADVTPLVLVADCVPLVARGAGRGGDGPLRLARRGRRASCSGPWTRCASSADGARSAAAIGPGDRAVLLRGRRRGRASVFARSGHTTRSTAGCSTCRALVAARARARRRATDVARRRASASSCNPELFFSHRRDGGVTGRQAGLAWLAS